MQTHLELTAPRSLSVIVPTYREALNIPHLVERVRKVREVHHLDLDLLFLDDQSKDGSDTIVAAYELDWIYFIERTGPRGLSQAVVDGLRIAKKEVLVVMDGDLSHPPESIPSMLNFLGAGHDFVLGSRYVSGGTTDDDWGFLRWLNSRVATLLARPLAPVVDPMSGFFAMWRRQVDFSSLNPTGYKIALELLVKCEILSPAEVPIHFTDRQLGESKLTFKQQILYLQHLRRLYMFKFSTGLEMLHFAIVGMSGVLVNLSVLTGLTRIGIATSFAVGVAIAVSIVTNFLLNRRMTFWYAKEESAWRQFGGFVAACSVGAIVNYACTISILRAVPELPLQLAALIGVIAGLGFNFLANRFIVFKKKHVIRPKVADSLPRD